MSKRATLAGCLVVALSLAGCYQDEATLASPAGLRPRITVRLTDSPFPYDSVASVNLYIVRIEASTGTFGDSTPIGNWVVITEPRKSVNLLAFQRGTTAFLGEGELPGGQYHEIRMTIDTSLSSITFNSGAKAAVDWRNHSGTNEMPIYAFVQYPVNVPTEGAEIVLDFDVGRSFLFDYYGGGSFSLYPQLRAVNTAAAGAIAGIVTTNAGGTAVPVKDASVTVCDSACSGGAIIATGLSDATGRYTVPFVSAGTYVVRIERIDRPDLIAVVTPNVQVRAGYTTQLSVSLPEAGSNGAYVRISGPSSVGVGGSIVLAVAVGDASGNPIQHPSVTWTSGDTSIARVFPVGVAFDTIASVSGLQPGFATIFAASGGLADSIVIQVVGQTSSGSVATVAVLPESASVALTDTSFSFQAQLRDSAGNSLSDRPVSWFSTDTSVLIVHGYGLSSGIQPRAAGTAFVRATSEGKTGQAKVTVH